MVAETVRVGAGSSGKSFAFSLAFRPSIELLVLFLALGTLAPFTLAEHIVCGRDVRVSPTHDLGRLFILRVELSVVHVEHCGLGISQEFLDLRPDPQA